MSLMPFSVGERRLPVASRSQIQRWPFAAIGLAGTDLPRLRSRGPIEARTAFTGVENNRQAFRDFEVAVLLKLILVPGLSRVFGACSVNRGTGLLAGKKNAETGWGEDGVGHVAFAGDGHKDLHLFGGCFGSRASD